MRQSAKVGMYETLHRCVQVFARATNTIEQFAMQQKCFGRAEILCKVPFVKCMQVAENGNKNAPSSLLNANVSLTGKTFGNTNKGGSVSKQGFLKRAFYCLNKLILFVVEVFPSATNTARQRQFCAKTASVMYFLCIISVVCALFIVCAVLRVFKKPFFGGGRAVQKQYLKTKRSK